MAELKARHAFGSSSGIDAALEANKIDAFDILFLDGNTDNPKVGWIDKNGNKVIIEDKVQIVRVESLPTANGDPNVVYIYNNEGYIWDGEKCISLSKPTDLTELEAEVSKNSESITQNTSKITDISEDVKSINSKINAIDDTYAKIEYEISNKPDGTLVDYRDKEIRVMCPSDTAWTLQQSGENADPNKYYIGFKAYAPSDDVVSFKEDLAEIISDETMYYFEGNDFAGVDKYGRKYSIVWLPVAKYDESNTTWTYYGANSTAGKYIGWYYSVEWYNTDGKIVASDCIRINLTNESCHTSFADQASINTIKSANAYTDKKIASITGGLEIVEF